MIHKMQKRARQRYARAGPARKPPPGQLSFAFPPAEVVPFIVTGGDPFTHALYLEDLGRPEEALAAYREAARRDIKRADALCNMGVIASQAQRLGEALSFFSQALQHEPGHAVTHHNLGNLYSDAGLVQAAQVHYEVAHALRPCPETLYNLALLLAERGRAGHAAAVLEQGLREGVYDDDLKALLLQLRSERGDAA